MADKDVHRSLQNATLPDEDVCCSGTHGSASYKAALYQLVWVMPHDLLVLTRPWL